MEKFQEAKDVIITGTNGKTCSQIEQALKKEVLDAYDIKMVLFYWERISRDVVRGTGQVDFCEHCRNQLCKTFGTCRFTVKHEWDLDWWCENLYKIVRANLSGVLISRKI